MLVNTKPTGTAASMPAGLAGGAAVSVASTLAGTWITAKILDGEVIMQEQVGYAVMVILILSSLMGALAAAHRIKRRRLMVCMMSGGIYLGILLLTTALFFGGQYSGVGETSLLILCGSALAVLLKPGKKIRTKHPKIRRRNR